jgi:hypothetical protein
MHAEDFLWFCIPLVKILMDWLRVNSSVLSNAAFRTKLHTGTLCKFFNQLLILESNLCGLKSKEIENVILPEEKRLLGFLPFCRTYNNLNTVLDENDPRAVWIRIYRTIKCADSLSESRLGFIERHSPSGYFSEIPFGIEAQSAMTQQSTHAIQPPNRRNVALQSIFNQLSTEPYSPTTATSPFGPEPNLPVSSNTSSVNVPFEGLCYPHNSSFTHGDEYLDDSIENDPPFGYVGKGASITSSGTDNSCSPKTTVSNPFLPLPRNDVTRPPDMDPTDFSHLFCSIWTPRQPDTNKMNNTDGWAISK